MGQQYTITEVDYFIYQHYKLDNNTLKSLGVSVKVCEREYFCYIYYLLTTTFPLRHHQASVIIVSGITQHVYFICV